MTADAWLIYYQTPERMMDGTIDLDDDTFKVALMESGYTPSLENDDVWADISASESSDSGYSQYTLTATWTRSGDTTTFDSDDATFTASGGDISVRYAVIYDDTPTSPADPLICYSLLDNSPADVGVTDGNTLTVQMNASGIWAATANP